MSNKKDLKYFMRKHEEEIITVPAPDGFVDEEGKPIEMEVRVLPNSVIQGFFKKYTKRSVATDKRRNPIVANGEVVYKVEKDNTRAVRHIVAEALVYPNLKDPKLMEFYGCHDISDMMDHVFPKPDEYMHVSKVVMAALGINVDRFDDSDGDDDENSDLEAAKN